MHLISRMYRQALGMLKDIDMSKLSLSEICTYLIDVAIDILQDSEVGVWYFPMIYLIPELPWVREPSATSHRCFRLIPGEF